MHSPFVFNDFIIYCVNYGPQSVMDLSNTLNSGPESLVHVSNSIAPENTTAHSISPPFVCHREIWQEVSRFTDYYRQSF